MKDSFDIGFLGGGQLARMSIQAAQRMGLSCVSLDPDPDSPAAQIAPSVQGELTDLKSLSKIFASCEFVTLENEFVPADLVNLAMNEAGFDRERLSPGADCLGTIQDKLTQRKAYAHYGAPSPRAVSLDPNPDEAIATVGFPMVLKARFGGYDGKGTRFARSHAELLEHQDAWGCGNWLAEEFVPFRRELAVMVCRSQTETRCFPTMETVQVNHVCSLVFPCDVDGSKVATQAVEAVNGFGLFGVELFETERGEILINEIAPRPHNSGHYSLDWGGPSQFELHIRLTLGLPLLELAGSPTCMANLLGQGDSDDFRAGIRAAAKVPGTFIHWYGKKKSRRGRKMGHINAVGADCRDRAIEARNRFCQAVI